jgi:hypothetical protein
LLGGPHEQSREPTRICQFCPAAASDAAVRRGSCVHARGRGVTAAAAVRHAQGHVRLGGAAAGHRVSEMQRSSRCYRSAQGATDGVKLERRAGPRWAWQERLHGCRVACVQDGCVAELAGWAERATAFIHGADGSVPSPKRHSFTPLARARIAGRPGDRSACSESGLQAHIGETGPSNGRLTQAAQLLFITAL